MPCVLQEVSQDLYIIGLIAAAACALSVIMGVIYFLFTLCGGAGSHICCAAVPVGYVSAAACDSPTQACYQPWYTEDACTFLSSYAAVSAPILAMQLLLSLGCLSFLGGAQRYTNAAPCLRSVLGEFSSSVPSMNSGRHCQLLFKDRLSILVHVDLRLRLRHSEGSYAAWYWCTALQLLPTRLGAVPWRPSCVLTPLHDGCRIIVIGMQLAYYGAAAIKIRDYTNKDTHGRSTYTPVPDWGWILETVAGVLWLIIAAVSACRSCCTAPFTSCT